MRLALAMVVYNFDLEVAEKVDWVHQKSYMLWEKEPFWVRVKRAEQATGG